MPWQSPWQFPWQFTWQPSGQGLALSLQSLLGGTVTPQVLCPPAKKNQPREEQSPGKVPSAEHPLSSPCGVRGSTSFLTSKCEEPVHLQPLWTPGPESPSHVTVLLPCLAQGPQEIKDAPIRQNIPRA